MRQRRDAAIEPSAKTDPVAAELSVFALEQAEDRRVLGASLWGAVGIHLLLLLINFPATTSEPREVEKSPRRPFVVKVYRYQLPPRPPENPLPERRALRVPVPDPTPDGPEPISVDESEPRVELPEVDASFLTIPEAPPLVGPVRPIPVGGNVRRPEKLDAPQPRYTEAARRTGTEGVVIVQAIIDQRGVVTSVRVLKQLPMGLTEEAVKAVKRWKFQPATLNGKPVDVYYNLTVNFQMQR